MARCAPEPMPTISVISTKWSVTAWPLLAQASLAFSMTVAKLRKSAYSSTRASSRADQNSPPCSLVRLMRSKVLLAAGTGNGSLMVFSSNRLQSALQGEIRRQLVVQCHVTSDVMQGSLLLLDGGFPRLNRAKTIRTPDPGQASRFERESRLFKRKPFTNWCQRFADCGTLGPRTTDFRRRKAERHAGALI